MLRREIVQHVLLRVPKFGDNGVIPYKRVRRETGDDL
jgi:hypothetical protein